MFDGVISAIPQYLTDVKQNSPLITSTFHWRLTGETGLANQDRAFSSFRNLN